MSRSFHAPCVLVSGLATLLWSFAAQAEETPSAQEFRELRRVVQEQSRLLESLSHQIDRLSQIVEGQKRPPGAPATHENAPESENGGDPGRAEPPKSEPVPPRAEAVPGGAARHVVVKGETLTSIAKQYSISLVDLQKANKIEDGRKLQIGQTLAIPAPKASSSPEHPAEKKETP